MPTIHSLLIGITEYPIYHHQLFGCVNDVSSMHVFLKKYAESQGLNYQPTILRNKDATRNGIINSFSIFDNVQDGDICLFYYSGHGSRAVAPKEFWNNPSGMNESIVCYDSRIEGGRDLMDKELGYLIWKATKNKDVHFLSIMDCCNAGSATRSLDGEKSKNIPPNHNPQNLEDYLGYEDYFKEKLTPPPSKHIHLAASKDSEKAKEKEINGEACGVFTYSLLQILEQGGIFQSYRELMQHVRIKVQSLTTQQHPQLELYQSDATVGFLGNTPKKGIPFTIGYDQLTKNWMLEAGSIQNIAASNKGINTLFELEDGTIVKVTKTYADQSIVEGMEKKDQNQTYTAWLKQTALVPLSIFINKNVPLEVQTEIKKSIPNHSSLVISEEEGNSKYIIHEFEDALILTRKGEHIPVFKRVPITTNPTNSVFTLLNDTADVANWESLLQHQNPTSRISIQDITIEVFHSHNSTSKNPTTPIELNYSKEDAQWNAPTFQLRITNDNPHKNYWVSALYMSSNFGIYNDFLRKQELQPGQEVWMTYANGDQLENTFKAFLNEEYFTWEIQEITDYIKVFISENELDTDSYVQQEIELDVNRKARSSTRGIRGIGKVSVEKKSDWTTKLIELKTIGPHPEKDLRANNTTQLSSISINSPAGFSAKATLQSLEKSTKFINHSIPSLLDSSADSQLMSVGKSINQADGLEVLEIFDTQGQDQININNPILINFETAIQENEVIIPFGYDPSSGLFYPIGGIDENSKVQIQELPDPTPTDATKSLGGSIKIFFQKVVLRRITNNYDYPKLKIAKIDLNEQVEYIEKQEEIIAEIKKSKGEKIAIFIHGIIGDTNDMIKLVQRVKFSNGTTLNDQYNTILTFDYENLHTPIEETARDLKRKLSEIEINENHNKTIHIYAHSMGGLVSRWFIEHENGSEIIQHLYQFGTPNGGSPWSNVQEMATFLITRAVNGASFMQPYIAPLSVVGWLVEKAQVTLQQMQPCSEFLKNLNNGTPPKIPYTLINGNTQLIAQPTTSVIRLFQKILRRFSNRPHHTLLDQLLFHQSNDIAVSLESQQMIIENEFVKKRVVASDHMSYFATKDSWNALINLEEEE